MIYCLFLLETPFYTLQICRNAPYPIPIPHNTYNILALFFITKNPPFMNKRDKILLNKVNPHASQGEQEPSICKFPTQ